MTAFNPSSGHDLGLPGLAPPHGTSDTVAPAEPSLMAAPAQIAADPAQDIPEDTLLLALFRQLCEEQVRLSGSEGRLSDQEMRASLARARDLARRIHKEPVSCAQDLLAKFLALRATADSTL